MADKIELQIARRLRQIADQVKEWENRDIQDQIASGSSRLSRPAYFADLESFAAMLEGTHIEYKLACKRPKKGRRSNPDNVDRDLVVAQIIDRHRRDPTLKVETGIEAAMKQFNMSRKSVEQADRRMRYALEPGNEGIVPLFERLAARRRVKITRLRTPKK